MNGLDNNNAATLALLADTARAGNRGGWLGGGEGGVGGGYVVGETLANGTATKTAIDCNSARMTDGMAEIRESFENQARNDQITSVLKGQTDSELRGIDRVNALAARMDANNLASIERDHRAEIAQLTCCCETKAEIAAVEARSNLDKLAQCRAELASKDTAVLNAKLDLILAGQA